MIWLGTQEGLNRYDGYEMVVYEHLPGEPDTLSHDWVWSVCPDASGTLWVGTEDGGLNRFNEANGTFVRYRHDADSKTSLGSDTVFGIIEDEDGFLWLSSNRGLSRVNPANGSVRNFDRFNVLRGDDFNFGARLQTRKGRLLFGGTNGIVSFDPVSGGSIPAHP